MVGQSALGFEVQPPHSPASFPLWEAFNDLRSDSITNVPAHEDGVYLDDEASMIEPIKHSRLAIASCRGKGECSLDRDPCKRHEQGEEELTSTQPGSIFH